jgi:hypothetical protein
VYLVRATIVSHIDAEDERVQKIIEYCESINQTKWNLTIQTVNYPLFKISVKKQLNNGSLVAEDYEGNVETGEPDLNMWIISANLSEGESIYRYASDAPRIKSEANKVFADSLRRTVFASFNETNSGMESFFAFFWDRETGILCGMSSIQRYYNEEDLNLVLDVKTDIEIVETTTWTGNGQTWVPFLFAISILVVLVTVAMLLHRRKRKGRHRKSLLV